MTLSHAVVLIIDDWNRVRAQCACTWRSHRGSLRISILGRADQSLSGLLFTICGTQLLQRLQVDRCTAVDFGVLGFR
jgi:hypothetical protein